jgi:acylglycerol lipase
MHDTTDSMIFNIQVKTLDLIDQFKSLFSIFFGLLLLATTNCAPSVQTHGGFIQPPKLITNFIVTSDGIKLPLTIWLPKHGPLRGAVVALHGFNDHSGAFKDLGATLAKAGLALYAYDQRGFGDTKERGIWPGERILTKDLKEVVFLVKKKHPNIPIHALGESMGGAVILTAMASKPTSERPKIDGAILSAPAVWGRSTMPLWQNKLLDTFAYILPMVQLRPQGLDIKPSDNKKMLRALADDPRYITETRIDAIYGLTNLMDSALESSSYQNMPLLILYGANDELVPKSSTCEMLFKLATKGKDKSWRLVFYPNGYHLLFRDLSGALVADDITAWLIQRDTYLPSGHEVSFSADKMQPKDSRKADCTKQFLKH